MFSSKKKSPMEKEVVNENKKNSRVEIKSKDAKQRVRMEKKGSPGINKEVAGGNKISSGNKRKARKSMFLPSHRVQMKNNYDNQFQSVKRGIVYFMEFFFVVFFSSSSRASFVRHTCLLLASYLPPTCLLLASYLPILT